MHSDIDKVCTSFGQSLSIVTDKVKRTFPFEGPLNQIKKFFFQLKHVRITVEEVISSVSNNARSEIIDNQIKFPHAYKYQLVFL